MKILRLKIVCTKDQTVKVLTPRETEYMLFVSLGFTNAEISKVLNVTISTVKKMLEIIFRKLKASDRAHAVKIADRYNFLPDELYDDITLKYPNAEKILSARTCY